MTGARSPSFDIPAKVSEVFSRFIAAEFAYFTPKGEPLCWPVTPYWYPQRGVLGVATGVAYPNKADYAKINPRVALYYSDPKGSGLDGNLSVLVQGDATVLDQDLQANTDRYVKELRARFPIARVGLNNLSVRLLDFYLPRLWVEITPVRIVVSSRNPGETRVIGRPLEPQDDPAMIEEPHPMLGDAENQVLRRLALQFREGVLAAGKSDGHPHLVRTPISPQPDGTLQLDRSPGQGAAALTVHRHSLGGIRFEAYMVRGAVMPRGAGQYRFFPRRLVGFFGNGLVFPISAARRMGRLRARLRRELERRGQPMPKLRIPQ